jgi:nicotinamidase-related amidase
MSAHAPRLDRDGSQLLVVDVQEKLAPHVQGHEALIARCAALIAAADGLGVPKLLTEHCPAQIGPVVPRLRERFAAGDVFVKTRFAATDHEAFRARLRHGRRQVVVAGMEAHVCVMQTALGLVAQGFSVFIAADAVGSRMARAEDRACALQRLREAGCTLAGTETLLFEWTRAGDDAHFRETLRLVKELP